MGYISSQFAKISTGFYDSNHVIYSYWHATDTLAEIEATGYFDDKAQYELVQVGDLFIVRGIDGTQIYLVTVSSSTEITIVPFAQQNIKTDYVSISSAELLALRATPKTLVAAPGADKLVQFVGAQLILDYGTAAYVESAANMAIKYTNGSGVAVSDAIEMTGFIDQTADMVTNAVAIKDAIVTAAGSVNQALVIHNTGAGEYTTGDGTITVAITYRVLDAGLA